MKKTKADLNIQPSPKFIQLFRSMNGMQKLKAKCVFCEVFLSDMLSHTRRDLKQYSFHIYLDHFNEAQEVSIEDLRELK